MSAPCLANRSAPAPYEAPRRRMPAAVPIAIPSTKPATPQFRDAGQALQAARGPHRRQRFCSAAQAALAAVQLLQPDSSEAQTLAARLKPLTARRDAALLAAQMCADQQSWPCAPRAFRRGARAGQRQRRRENDPRARDPRNGLGAAQLADDVQCKNRPSDYQLIKQIFRMPNRTDEVVPTDR